jgi:acyl-CoA thioester hydrolase
MEQLYIHQVQVYYEDTDHSGVVYHANYLKYFERAREHMLGVEALVSLYRDQGIGFVVYQARLKYLKGAQFGDSLSIRSKVRLESSYRLVFMQDAHSATGELLVKGEIELACINAKQQLVPIPQGVLSQICPI